MLDEAVGNITGALQVRAACRVAAARCIVVRMAMPQLS